MSTKYCANETMSTEDLLEKLRTTWIKEKRSILLAVLSGNKNRAVALS